MKTLVSGLLRGIKGIWALVYLALGIAVIFILAYLLGRSILDGLVKDSSDVLIGNDSAFALSLVYWFGRFFPRIPLWYPLQGMGVSLFYSYPMATTFWIIILQRLTSLSAVEIFRLLSFLAFPLTALGIYLLAWTRLKQQTIGLVAAVFFLLSQASWLFQSLHGIFAQSFSLILVAPALMFFDLFLARLLKGEGRRFWPRVFLVATVFLVGIAFLTHVVTATMVALMLVFWGGWRGLMASRGDGFKGVLAAGAVVFLAAFLAAFWLLPFSSYTRLANREGLNTRSVAQIQEESLKIPSLLGRGVLGEGIYRYDFFFFATPVLAFLAIGIMASLLARNKKVIGLALIALVFVFLTALPIYLPFLVIPFRFFLTAVYFRGLIPALILVPLVAAWGVWALPAGIVLGPLAWWERKKGKKAKGIGLKMGRVFLTAIVSLLTLGIAFWSIVNLAQSPPPNPEFEGTYKYQFQPYGPSLSEDFEKFLADLGGWWSQRPKLAVSPAGMEGRTVLNEALDRWLKIDERTILDVSPYAAGGAIMQGVGLVNDTRFINLYHYYASLIHRMWGYQAGVFFGQEPLYQSPKLLADLSDWFGLKYAVVVPGFDPILEKYQVLGWRPVEEFNQYAVGQKPEINQGPWEIEVWEKPNSTGLFTVSRRPVVLVITDFDRGGYDQVFRAANLGALPYPKAWLVEGTKKIDDYSLEELSQFDGIILHGYGYRNRRRAWGGIRQYVEQGGRLFVETGWQFVAKDWGSKSEPAADFSLPVVLPVAKTAWGNIGTSWKGTEAAEEFWPQGLADFDPPVWEGKPWGMALARKADLKPGAKPLLWQQDQILMASWQVGEGKVIWSGTNILSHLNRQLNEKEAEFLGALLIPLFSQAGEREAKQEVVYQRPSPDRAEFIFSQAADQPFWFLFRESFHPFWQAKLAASDPSAGGLASSLKIYRGGPGFALVKLPPVNQGDILRLEYRLNFWQGTGAKLVSAITLVALLAYLLAGRQIEPKIKKIFGGSWQNKLRKQIKSFGEEEDY